MAEVTLELIKQLREKTNVGMMNCKGALKEADGDLEAAEIILRKKGMAAADKKASRETSEGLVATTISDDAKTGVMIDLGCETDFLSKGEGFRAFVAELLQYAMQADAVDSLESYLALTPNGADSIEDIVKVKVGSMGENMGIGNVARYTVAGAGCVSSYIHMDGKIGVLLELGCESADTEKNEALAALGKDICLHIAASNPICLGRDEVPADLVEKEKDVYRDQVKGKPENIIDKIVEGKLDKFYKGSCLLEQSFIKDPDQTIKALLEASSTDFGDTLQIRRFARFAVGEVS
ncbi:MAG: translation elongation factor Ts [Verrucomicrobiales bacterium]|nr:translation elongation factor Ts [Verrucomicrobiales bacterium]